VQAVVIPFLVIVRREFAQRAPQVRFPMDHLAVEAFFFDGAAKPFRVRITVGRVVRYGRPESRRPRACGEGLAPFGIAVADQDAMAPQRAIIGVRVVSQVSIDIPDELWAPLRWMFPRRPLRFRPIQLWDTRPHRQGVRGRRIHAMPLLQKIFVGFIEAREVLLFPKSGAPR